MITLLQNFIDAVSLGSLYALTALGVGLLFGVLRLINFAHANFITIGAYAIIVPSTNAIATLYIGAWHWAVMSTAVVVIVVALAVVTEFIVFRPLRRADPPTLLVASFALAYALQYITLLIYDGRPKAVDIGSNLAEQVMVGELRIPKLEILTIAVTLALIVSLALFLKRTRYGIQIRAAAEDFRMARLLGVRANTVIAVAFALSGVLAAAVSLLFLARTGMLAPRMGLPLVLIAFVATVIGGMGSLVGAAVGGFVVGFASVVLQVVLPVEIRQFRDAFVYLLVIAILLWRPAGLIQVRAITERV
ncbi:MAG: branched-chain amino acid ABC transporter permease [Alphaproteobacteria bacterium]|nr:branched-chain amino acid ABC transporter permease [Alphaproteobacteria bacterium]